MALATLAPTLIAQQPTAVNEVYLFKDLQPAPALTVTTLEGKPLTLSSLRGQVVLLNFWATWCTFCRQEIPEFEHLQRQYAGKLQIVGLSVDATTPATAAQTAAKVGHMARQMGINYPVAIASDTDQARFGDLSAIPVTWLIDANGKVEQKNHGANPYEVFNTEVRALLGLPVSLKVVRVDQLSPDGKVATINIPGIADVLRKLTPEQRDEALDQLNRKACTCGCDWSIATCRVKDPACGYSLPLARQLIAKIAAGKSN
ncbi:MAG: TlpA family protein disulfide reductase [Terriglobales bacterium]